MIVTYIGRRGAGKTLTMVKDAYLYYKQGRKVYSNMEGISFGKFISNEDILKLDKNSDIEHAVLLIDEIQILFDSRRAMKKTALNFSNFVQQIRKRDIILLATTQFSNAVEKRFRDHTDIVAKPKFKKEYLICEVTYIDITSTQDEDNLGIPESIGTFFNGEDIFQLYNTGEMIK